MSELTHDRSAVAISLVDMPALNTTQFGWVESSFPEHPQPVPPIFQPEVGARAVADVADRPRRRTWVGLPTVATILGSRFAGRFLDWYLARNAFEGQFSPDHPHSSLPTNLFHPVPDDHGAHGVFDDVAKSGDLQTWAIRHRVSLGVSSSIAAASAALGAATAAHRWMRSAKNER